MTPESAQQYANAWVAAWNAADVEAVLSHYADDVVFSSPFVRLLNNESGAIHGKEALRAYFSRAFTLYPELHFELVDVFAGVGSLIMYYRSVLNLNAAEYVEFNNEGLVVRTVAHYANQ